METPIFATAPLYNPGANTYSALNWGGWKASQQATPCPVNKDLGFTSTSCTTHSILVNGYIAP